MVEDRGTVVSILARALTRALLLTEYWDAATVDVSILARALTRALPGGNTNYVKLKDVSILARALTRALLCVRSP